MRPVLRTSLLILVAALAVVAGFAGGYTAHPSTGGPSPTTLGIVAAGSLSPHALLPAMASAYANVTPGVVTPTAAQVYEGSSAAASQIVAAGPNSPFDLFVSADYRVIPRQLENGSPSYALGEAVFASDPLVLAYVPAALPTINATNWYTAIQGSGIVLGVPNASADPLGANVILALELQDSLAGLSGALYSHFFTGSMGGFAGITAHTRYVPENTAALALSEGEVQAYMIYASYARANHLASVPLPASVDLGGISAGDVAAYSAVATTVLSGTGTAVVRGAPALFALTVPTNAPTPAVGDAFAAWLLASGQAPWWTAAGFALTPTVWTVGTVGFLPSGASPLPADLAALI